MRPYVVRFISTRSGVGKTYTASRLAENLLKAGYSVGVVKHSVSSISLEEKDSKKYLDVGVPVVAVAGREITVLYTKELVDDLSELIRYVHKPLILVEGFRKSSIGDSVAVVDDINEATELIDRNTIAIVLTGEFPSPGNINVSGVPIFNRDSIDLLANVVVEKALNHFLNQLPKLNCGMCGFETCRSLASKILRGAEITCPVLLDVKLVVNNREISLNPFVKNVVYSVVDGIVKILKNIPQNIEVIKIEIRRGKMSETGR